MEYILVTVLIFQDSLADADYDWTKDKMSDTSCESENELKGTSKLDYVSDSSAYSDIIETLPNMTRFLSPVSEEINTVCASTSSSASEYAQVTNIDAKSVDPDNEITDSSISVPSANNQEFRHYDKMYYCMYCKKARRKLKVHLLAVHKEEDEVLQMQRETDPMKKALIYEKVRNIGNHLHNIDVIKSGDGELCVAYRPRGEVKTRAADYGPCPYCFAYYPKKELWRHNTSCKFSSKTKQKRNALAISSQLLLPNETEASSTLLNVTRGMKADTVTRIVKSDPILLAFGEKLCTKHGHDSDRYNYIRQRLREVARLVQELRRETREDDKQFQDFMYPTNFQLITKCCKLVAGYDVATNTYATPSLALKIGHTLQKCLKILIGKSIENEDKDLQCRAEELTKLFDINWTDDISSNALRTLHDAKRNNSQSALPLANDVKLLSQYLNTEAEATSSALKENDISAWVRLNEIVLAQCIMFNRRRAGEVSKMSLDDYAKKQLSNLQGDFDGCLSQFEKELCNLFYRTEIIAKRGRISPVLFTKQMIVHLDLLIEKRFLIANPSNTYLFPTRTTTSHIRGTDCLRTFSKACGAEEPNRLTSTKLRKHIATMSQLLNLKDNELDVLAQFLGHDIRVHREFYRLPEATVQVAKVSKLLLMMERGDPSAKYTSIADVTLDQDDLIEGTFEISHYTWDDPEVLRLVEIAINIRATQRKLLQIVIFHLY